jgi:hypothetical protein
MCAETLDIMVLLHFRAREGERVGVRKRDSVILDFRERDRSQTDRQIVFGDSTPNMYDRETLDFVIVITSQHTPSLQFALYPIEFPS